MFILLCGGSVAHIRKVFVAIDCHDGGSCREFGSGRGAMWSLGFYLIRHGAKGSKASVAWELVVLVVRETIVNDVSACLPGNSRCSSWAEQARDK